MKKPRIYDKHVYKYVGTRFMALACDHTGQPVNGKCLNRVMKDIVGQSKFFSRLYNIKTDTELRILFNGADLMDIFSLVNNEAQLSVLKQTLELEMEINALKQKIKKRTKSGKKCKDLEERYHKLNKIYNKSIKTFKTLLGIKDLKKNAKPKDKYSDIIKFHKKYNGEDEYNYFSLLSEDDDEDEEYFDAEGLSPDQLRMLGMRVPANLRPQPKRYPGYDIDFDEDDEDESDYEGDDDDDDFDVKVMLEEQNDKIQKILSAVGALISINQAPQNSLQTPTNISMHTLHGALDDEDDDEDEPNFSERFEYLERAVAKIADFIEYTGGLPADSDTESGNGPQPQFVPTMSEEQKEIQDMLNAITGQSDEELEARYQAMKTPELIEERNSSPRGDNGLDIDPAPKN